MARAGRRAARFGRISRARNGCAERRLWRRQVRLQRSGRGPLEPDRSRRSTSTRSPPARLRWSRAARSAPRPAITPAARPKDKHTVVDDLTANSVWWDGNRKMSKENFDTLLADFQAHVKGKKLFAQDLYGGADPKYQIKTRVFTEYAWHSLFIRQLLIRPEQRGPRQVRARTHHRRSAVVQARRQASRRPRRLRHDGGDRFHPQDRADLRLVLRRRDEEVGVHHAQLLSAGAERRADALLGQCQPRGRERAVLRPVRHRQDHAVGRPEPHSDRRRRARLGSGRHLQFRGRLLRQDASSSRRKPSR